MTSSGICTALPLLPAIVLLFVGCAANAPRYNNTGAAKIIGNLGDISAGDASAPKMRYALVALPDRIYEVPFARVAKTAASSTVAATRQPALPRLEDVVAVLPAPVPVNVAIVGGLDAIPPIVIEPTRAFAATAVPPKDTSAQAQPAALAAAIPLPAKTSPAVPVVSHKNQVARLPAQPLSVAMVTTPKLKLDTDYESITHPIKFAFDQHALGTQAQALIKKIIADAKTAIRIKLNGFADGIGSHLANERVATVRANSKYRRVDVDITKPKQSLMISLRDPVNSPQQ